MASIIKRPNKRKWLQFSFQAKRHTWRLGQVNIETARRCKLYVEQLIVSEETGERLSRECEAWIREISIDWKNKLIGFGLIKGAAVPHNLPDYLQFILDNHYANLAERTNSSMRQARAKLLDFFGHEQDVRRITTGDIKLYKTYLEGKKLAPATVALHLVKLRTYLSYAVQHELIDVTPFKRIDIPSQVNEARKAYVPPKVIKQLLLSCDPYWQAAICLSRFGGLRAPSDVFGLTWERVNFAKRVIVQFRKKTQREIAFPMSTEIYYTLSFIFDNSNKLDEYVFPPAMAEYQHTRGSYAQLRRLIIRAGLEPWPVLWNSMRTSWGQDLKDAGISQQTRSRWLDHTVAVDQKHYDLGPGDKEFKTALALDSGVFTAQIAEKAKRSKFSEKRSKKRSN